MRLRWHSSTRQSSTCSFHFLIIAEGDHATELGVSQKEGSIGLGMDERMECLRFDPYAATSKVSGGTAQISAISVIDSQHWLPVKGHRACLECRRKKTKCDMSQPVCGLCERTGGSCTFPTKRKTPERTLKPHEPKKKTRIGPDQLGMRLGVSFAKSHFSD
ncbi:Fungal Zn2-Cys6 binuclear cluster domain-containing protein [Colletotrichum asianum]